MSKKKKSSHRRRKGNTLRYLTFAIVIAAIAALGVFFYNKNFNIGKLLLSRVRGEAPVSAWTATLCFGDETGEYLIKEHRIISSGQTPEAKASALVQELLKGPISRGTRTLPQQTREGGLSFDSGILTVDFSVELKKNHPGGSASEMLTVYSVVNTLAMNIPEVRRVQFLIDSKKIDNIAGHIDCLQPIAPRPDLVH